MSAKRAPAGESSYVVQIARQFEGHPPTWEDIATVTVPGKTHRLQVISRALAEANVQPPDDGVEVRVLDARSAAQVRVTLHRPELEIRIG